ncbi:MAG: reverse transcriptase family protein [Minisyncoccia bacterium]
MEAEFKRMQQCDVLEPIESSTWVSNMVVVPKSNGAVRICCDLSDLNKAVIPDRYPLPTIEELSRFFAGSRYFTKIDLKWGYLQVLLHPSVRHLTAMITPLGLFQWKRLPFGLSSAPSYFQMVMSIITKGLEGVKFLIDDIIICGRLKAEHDIRLEQLCKRLHEYNVLINDDKSKFCVTSVDFVGHTVSSQGVSPLQSNIEAITKLETPDSTKRVRSFLGAANFYRKFIPHFSDIAEPLVSLTRKDAEFIWNPAHQQAFEKLRAALGSTDILAHFDSDMPTLLTTDASGIALAAYLSEIHRYGTERTVAFASRTLSPTERAYSTSEREALACIWACEHWHYYLYGRRFTLRTDHSALKALLSGDQKGRKPMRLLRWADRLQQYDYEIQYRPGVDNVVADLLSRSCDSSESESSASESSKSESSKSESSKFESSESSADNEGFDTFQMGSVFGSPALSTITQQQLK